ncbi:MAG: helix-turn-helix domain-containing protein [Clostridiales bacterium]|jgi:transcriptional regulator with XRE-family HTH domain|nr:helix-turn-helix domain-containing protein [Clostridiales bacterium]
MKIFGERLRDLRTEKGLSAMALAKQVGLSDAAIIRWENDTNDILGENLVKLAQYFGVSTDYLLGLEN